MFHWKKKKKKDVEAPFKHWLSPLFLLICCCVSPLTASPESCQSCERPSCCPCQGDNSWGWRRWEKGGNGTPATAFGVSECQERRVSSWDINWSSSFGIQGAFPSWCVPGPCCPLGHPWSCVLTGLTGLSSEKEIWAPLGLIFSWLGFQTRAALDSKTPESHSREVSWVICALHFCAAFASKALNGFNDWI